jgi:hypothetical protein
MGLVLNKTYLEQKQLTSTSLEQFKFALPSAKQLDTTRRERNKRMSPLNLIKNKKKNKGLTTR